MSNYPIKRLLFNFKRNRFISVMGLETSALGLYLAFFKNMFDDEKDIFAPYIHHAQDPFIVWALIFVGIFAFIVGIFNFHEHHQIRASLSLMFGIWVAYFAILFWHDINAPGIQFHLSSVLIIFVIFSLFVELWEGDER